MKASILLALILATGLAGGVACADEAKPAPDPVFGDWVLHCTKPKDGQGACALRQKIMAQETRLPVAAFAIARHRESHELRLSVVLPLGLDIPAGVTGKVGNVPLAFTIQTCVRRGCIASTQVDDKLLEALHGAESFTTTFKMRNVDEPTTIPVSLKGLADGLKALDAR